MTDFKRERLNWYIGDAEQFLTTIQKILQYPETPAQAAAASMTRAAIELVAGIKQQMKIDGGV
ncbi:hypothetical protein [Sporomusa acidovorans]|uniref:Uncharacterized protein n=1 Tax=Sporomusa acidovorans (strain ATCC 49682 / DSM 3132 / Mol) TaxID=1123286 RepID=A0ABZ3IWV6_SPOA4|nr:hypothetical protein [Sporomusa acidovorans]OZC23664.1 hypothetical protein SPACI_05660 [Sporomusa acidovorans DSM 3132]SDE24321.1 hypothetical protein SAMN04488499_101092 [Sporomusa acidovorans]